MPGTGGLIQQQRHGRHRHVLRVVFPAVLLLLVTGLRSNADEDPTGSGTVTGGPVTVPSYAVSTPYEDQYLIVGDLPDDDSAWAYGEQLLGRRHLAAELMYYDSDADFFGDDVERGARMYWSRETESWGIIDLEAQYSDVDSSFVGRQSVGGEAIATLRQSAMPVSSVALLDTALGHQRIPRSSLLHGGYRYRLPTSAMLGLSGELTGVDKGIRFATGDVGTYRGVRIPQFDETGGRLTTIAYDQRINPQLELGAELMNLGGDDDVHDHTSLLFGTRYQSPDDAQEHAVRLLADDDGRKAVWTDSRHYLGAGSTVRYGAFYFDPELAWADLPISNDQTGLYFRADTGNARYNLSGGYDYYERGLDSTALATSDSHALFLSGTLRLRQQLSLGFNTGFTKRTLVSVNDDDQLISRLNAFANIGSPLGNTRIEVFSHELESDLSGNQRTRSGAGVSFNWRMPQKVGLTTELRIEQNEDNRGDRRRTELSTLFRYNLIDNVSLGLSSALYRTRGDTHGQDDGLSLSVDARWAFLPDWYASLSVSRNRSGFQVGDDGFLDLNGTAGHSSFWLTVRYERRTGRPFPTLGLAHSGMSGTGTISGQVFFDLNRDGVRQPSEEPAVGAVVLLDGRFETRTDGQGRYSFAPVPTGEHEVGVLVEELPLPWGLDDETPRPVVSRLRESSAVDFPLIVIE